MKRFIAFIKRWYSFDDGVLVIEQTDYLQTVASSKDVATRRFQNYIAKDDARLRPARNKTISTLLFVETITETKKKALRRAIYETHAQGAAYLNRRLNEVADAITFASCTTI